GPQMLSTFIGQSATPVWTLDMVDNARFHTGVVWQAEVHVKPMPPKLINGQFVSGTVQPNSANYYPLDLPVDVSKVTVTLTLPGGASPDVFLAIKKDLLPTLTNYDYIANFSGGGNSVTISFDRNSQPPLIPGEYIIGVLN